MEKETVYVLLTKMTRISKKIIHLIKDHQRPRDL